MRPSVERSEFAKLWNKSRCVKDVAIALGWSEPHTRNKATILRRQGVRLKYFKKYQDRAEEIKAGILKYWPIYKSVSEVAKKIGVSNNCVYTRGRTMVRNGIGLPGFKKPLLSYQQEPQDFICYKCGGIRIHYEKTPTNLRCSECGTINIAENNMRERRSSYHFELGAI